jgi:tRNA-specific 2-thiouridylase
MSAGKHKVLVAMSGGVDSSVAAALLLREGYDVVGCFMRLGSPGESFDELIEDHAGSERSEDPGACNTKKIKIGHQGCCSINDAADARMVAAKLGIPFYVCNFKKDFGRIIDYFVDEYNAGRTPNPCVRCNDWLKFGKLHDYAKQIDAQFVASGHYARIEHAYPRDRHPSAFPRLLRAVDHSKDQSYVLFGAPRHRLSEMLLPIGGYHKREVRRMAREFDLPVFDKPDSQEICFVPDNDYAGLVARRTPEKIRAGAILNREGREIGTHAGHQHFTIGQRKGVGVALGHPIYVVSKDPANNTITMGERDELRIDRVIAHETNWFIDVTHARAGASSPPSEDAWMICTAKFRYNSPPVAARVRAVSDDSLEVKFDEPQYGIAPGQAVVCYDNDAVICGGWINSAE